MGAHMGLRDLVACVVRLVGKVHPLQAPVPHARLATPNARKEKPRPGGEKGGMEMNVWSPL